MDNIEHFRDKAYLITIYIYIYIYIYILKIVNHGTTNICSRSPIFLLEKEGVQVEERNMNSLVLMQNMIHMSHYYKIFLS